MAGDQRPGCVKDGVRYYCGENTCPCPGFREAEVARLQDSEVQLILKGLLRNLTQVRDQQAAGRTQRQKGVVEGLNIAIAAVRRRVR